MLTNRSTARLVQNAAASLRSISRLLSPLALLLAAATTAHAGDPVETWLGATGKTTLTPRVTALVLVESKFRDDLDFRYQDYGDIGVSIKLTDHWSVAPMLRLIRNRTAPNAPWVRVVNPMPTVNWQDTFGGWKLSWRNQLDIQYWEDSADKTCVRSRIQVMPPMAKDSRWQPYLNNEFFFDDRTQRYSQNRAFLGTYYKINDNWQLEAYAGYKSDWKADHWCHTRLIGARVGLSF